LNFNKVLAYMSKVLVGKNKYWIDFM